LQKVRDAPAIERSGWGSPKPGQLPTGLGRSARSITSTAAAVLLAAADSGANASMKVMGQIDLDTGHTSWPTVQFSPNQYRFVDLS